MAPYEALYGRPCQSPVCWIEVGKRTTTGLELVRGTFEKMDLIRKVFSWRRAGRRVTLTDDGDLWSLRWVIMFS